MRRLRKAGQFVKELGLVGFDDQEVIGLFFFDQMGGGCFLRIEGIGADQSAAQVQVLKEFFETGDFVGFGRDGDLAAEELGLSIQGTEELDGVAIDFGGGADAFAIDGQGGDVEVLEMRAEPVVDDGVQLGRIQALENSANGRFAGRDEPVRLGGATGAQAAELILIQRLGELADVQEGIVAGDHRGSGDGDDGGDVTMAPASVAAGVFEFSESLEQAPGLLAAQGILAGIGLAAVRSPSWRHDRGGKDLASFGVEGVEKDRLGMVVELIEVNARAAEALGHADFDPIGRAITGAFETLGIHIGFDQEQGVVVLLLPIVAEAFEIQAQEVRGQIGRLTLGREQSEASVTGDEMTTGVALRIGPADPTIPRAQMESGAGPAEQSNPLAVFFGDVTKGLADHPVLLEVMMLADEFVPERLFSRSDQLDGDLLGGNFFENLGDRMCRTKWCCQLG